MGFWEKVKSVAISAKCLTGWHAGEYTQIKGQLGCDYEKTCPDCNEHLLKKIHKYTDWRFTNNSFSRSCDSIRNCIYCDHQQERVIHEYKTNGKDSRCRIVEKCSRCGDEQFGSESHNWIALLGHEVKMNGKRKCKDCGAIG